MSLNSSFWPSWWIGFVVAVIVSIVVGYFSKSVIVGGLSGFLTSFFVTGIIIKIQYSKMKKQIEDIFNKHRDN
jgi:ascorbate-specific PTS system EIIC-type component UlaA